MTDQLPLRLQRSKPSSTTRGVVVAAALLGLSYLPALAPVWAQSPAMAGVAQSPVFSIRGFSVTGNNPLAEGETTRVLAPFLRQDATLATLQGAASALTTALRQQGFSLHSVSLPPQEVGDTISLQVTSFTVGKVSVLNNTPYSTANVRGALPELREGATPDLYRLSIQNALANETLNRRLSVVMSESDVPGQINATVRVTGTKPWAAGASLSNGGSRETGRDRLTLVASHGNLWDIDHAVDLAYTTSLESPRAVSQVGASYKIPFYTLGSTASIGFSSSTIKGDFGSFTTNGAGSSVSLAYVQHLGGSGSLRHFVQFRLDDKVSKASAVNGLPIGVDRRSRPIALGYFFKGQADSLPYGVGVDYSVNLPTGAGNNDVSYQLEDPQRPLRARWAKLRVDGNYGLELPAKFQLQWRGQAQYSNAPLITSEQLLAGGRTWLRGAGSVFSDRGVLSALDVVSPELAPGLRGLVFLDVASLGNTGATLARPGSDVLASAGLGLRYNYIGGWYALADYAQVIKGSAVPLAINSAAPQRGNASVYVTVGARF